jgi:YVTN family beta-propeller protein
MVVIIVIVGVAIVYLFARGYVTSPASIAPVSATIDQGESISIGVSWKGGSPPFTINLYSSSNSACTTSSNLVSSTPSLASSQYAFTVSPQSDTYYCGVVLSPGGSSGVSSVALVKVGPALTAPTLSITPSAVDVGQSATVSASVTIGGGSPPYAVALVSGSSATCSADTALVPVTAGSNPQTSLTQTSATFAFASPSLTTYYCAVVTNSGSAAGAISSKSVAFSLVPALTATVTPGSPKLDAGQSLALKVVASHGITPYQYQWYTGTSCSSDSILNGMTNGQLSVSGVSSSTAFSVLVTDSSPGTPAGTFCAKSTVTVSPTFAGTPVSIAGEGTFDSGQPTTLTVTWSHAGTGPYNVQLATSASSTCASPTPSGNPQVNVTTTSATFNVTPASTAYYCAVISDHAHPAQTASTTAGAHLVVSAALKPVLTLSPPGIDTGQTSSVTATIALTTGTSPFDVTFYQSSTTVCPTGATKVGKSVNGVTSTSVTFTFPSPSAVTTYCVAVKDSATTPVNATTAFAFQINPPLTVALTPVNPAAAAFQPISITATPSHGTSPYTYQWYTGSNCSAAGKISAATSTTFSPSGLNETTAFSVLVSDASKGTPSSAVCSPVTVKIVPALVVSLVVSPLVLDSGQTGTVHADVAWTGGAAPYTVTLTSGTSATCSADTAVVSTTPGTNPRAGVTLQTANFTFASPTAATYYCATVKDSATTPATVLSSQVFVAVSPALVAPTMQLFPTVIDSGQAQTVTATASWFGGTAPYNVTLMSGSSSTCSADTVTVPVNSGSNPILGTAGTSGTFSFSAPASPTYYCVKVVDSSGFSQSSLSATIQMVVSPSLGIPVLTLSNTVLDAGQFQAVTATVSWTGGSAPYTVKVLSGGSPFCSSDTTIVGVISPSNPQTGLTSTTASFSLPSPGASQYYCATVSDSSTTPELSSSSALLFTVNPALAVTLGDLSPSSKDSGQTLTGVTATISWTGGSAPFTITLLSGSSPSCSSDNTQVGTTMTNVITSPVTPSFASPSASTYYCVKVVDSSGVPVTTVTGPSLFTVNVLPTVTISPGSPTVGLGQTVPLTAYPVGGTPPYGYQWYTGGTCSTPISGQSSSSYTTSPMAVSTTLSVRLTDSSTGTPAAGPCASVTVTVTNGPEGIAANPTSGYVYVVNPSTNGLSVVDSSTSTVIATVSVGSFPWGVAVNPGTGLVYVTNYGAGTVSVVNESDFAVVGTIHLGGHPSGVALNPSLGYLYVANAGTNVISVISLTTDAVVKDVTVGSSPAGVAVGPGPSYTVYVADFGSNTISVVDQTFRVTTVFVDSSPWGVAVNPNNNQVFVTNSGSGTVTVIDGSTYAQVKDITVGSTPEGIAINSATNRAFVANSGSNTVTVIDTTTDSVTGSALPVGAAPWGVALDTATGTIFVSNAGANTVTVIAASTTTPSVVGTVIV